ncbi:MAG: C1 family peptidase [Bacteroidales bacterium]|jgi:hypothetical protein|nr:C1 family peptidase [Bacteroidales bacterium]
MKKLNKLFNLQRTIIYCIALSLFLLASCKKEPSKSNPSGDSGRHNGYNYDSENPDEIQKDRTNMFGAVIPGGGGGSSDLPEKCDVIKWLPPVGDQGQYGTCVTWSVGYGMRSYLNAKMNNLSQQQLADKKNQFSPADLWMAMASDDKGVDCNGSNFESAFEILVNRGITTLQTAPYSELQCNGKPSSTWTNDAGKYKILNYRIIDKKDITVENLKWHLSEGRLISFGAKLGDNFMSWSGSGVLSSETYNSPDMQHAYHALVLAGYDNSKGSGGAFLVYNSWGERWCDNGYIWVDYNFFVNNFVFAAFIATPDNNLNPNEDGEINEEDLVPGLDLAVYDAYEEPWDTPIGDPEYNRVIWWNVFNCGTETVRASSDWDIIYAYFNAYDADDLGISVFVNFTDEDLEYGEYEEYLIDDMTFYSMNWDIPPGKSMGMDEFDITEDFLIGFEYKLPPLTGYYYFLVWVDPLNSLGEENKDNNLFFLCDDNGDPFYFVNGQIRSKSGSKCVKSLGNPNCSKPMHNLTTKIKNAYSPKELSIVLKRKFQSGELKMKMDRSKMIKQKKAIWGKTLHNTYKK